MNQPKINWEEMPPLRGQNYNINEHKKKDLVRSIERARANFWKSEAHLICGCFGINQNHDLLSFLSEIAPEFEFWVGIGEFGDEIWCARRTDV